MVYRIRHLANDEVQSSDDSTYSLELPRDGNLHALFVRANCTNGATSGRGVSILDAVDTIRVVGNGDERLYELNSFEMEKWVEAQQGVALDMDWDEAASAVQSGVFPLYFGRAMFDPEMFLPLDRIQNPRLEIVYSPTISATVGFATGTTTFNVLGLWTPPRVSLSYRGTLITRTIKNFTTAASGDETTDIDILEPIRAIGVYAYEAGIEDGVDVTRLRLEANSGEFDIVAGDWLDLLEIERYRNGNDITHQCRAFLSDTDTLDTRLGDIKSVQVTPFQDVVIASNTFPVVLVDTVAGDRLTFNCSTADLTAASEDLTADATDDDIWVSVTGLSPSYFAHLPFMSVDDPSAYLNPRDYSKLRLVLSQGGAGGTCRIGLQYLKTF